MLPAATDAWERLSAESCALASTTTTSRMAAFISSTISSEQPAELDQDASQLLPLQPQIASGHVLRLGFAQHAQNRWRDILQCPVLPQSGIGIIGIVHQNQR